MSPKHWYQINGFSNDYFGWGGEDDELHHRLRLTQLLYGDCYPFCRKGDPQEGRTGISIKRPPKGHGRFSGKFMHSMNHTKRITDSKAYEQNLRLLREIGAGSDRWRRDGLSNLKFRIVDHAIDDTDAEEYGITYHHVKVRRGEKRFELKSITVAVPAGELCPDGGQPAWRTMELGSAPGVPFSLKALREKVIAFLGEGCPVPRVLNFLLVDLSKSLAKVVSDATDKLVHSFYRSLQRPHEDGLIVADGRPEAEITSAFDAAGARWVPPADFSACTAALKHNGPKYSIHRSSQCNSGGWNPVEGGFFKGFNDKRKGMEQVFYCDNEKYWIQRFTKGTSCAGKWNGLKWVIGGHFWVPKGNSYCIGTRRNGVAEESFSRIMQRPNCGGDGFDHDFSFGPISDMYQASGLTICIGRKNNDLYRISAKRDCHTDGFHHVGRFAALRAPEFY